MKGGHGDLRKMRSRSSANFIDEISNSVSALTQQLLVITLCFDYSTSSLAVF